MILGALRVGMTVGIIMLTAEAVIYGGTVLTGLAIKKWKEYKKVEQEEGDK